MTLRVVPGPDSPRADAGYRDEPRLRARPTGRPTRWEFIEVEDRAVAEDVPTGRLCTRCGESASVLHQAPGSTLRTICGGCQGAANRERIGWAKAAEPKEPRR